MLKRFFSKLKLPMSLYIASRYIKENLSQSGIIMLAVGMGVSIIIFIPSVNLSFFEYFLTKTVHNSAHIQVSRELETEARNKRLIENTVTDDSTILMTDQTLSRRRNIKAYDKLTKQLLQIPGVIEAAPYVKEQVIIVRGSKTKGIDFRGIIPEKEMAITDLEDSVKQGNLNTLGNNEVFIGYMLADDLGVNVGNRVQLLSAYNRRTYKVAGLIDTGNYFNDMSIVYTTIEAGQQLLNLPNEATGIGLKVDEIYEAENIADQIRNSYPVKTRSWIEDNRTMLEQITNFKSIIAVVSSLIVLAAASSITSVLIMVVASKSREIGILKAMGTPPLTIMRIFVSQAIFLGVLGSIAGVIGGFIFIQLYNVSPMSRADTFLGIGREPVTMNLEYTLYAVMYAMGSSFLASLFPAWHASRLNPVEAINQ